LRRQSGSLSSYAPSALSVNARAIVLLFAARLLYDPTGVFVSRGAASLFILLSLAARAAADCPPGQTVSDDTAGHCCWPVQAWSTSRAQCVGIPQCPTGMQASGETCVIPSGQLPSTTPPSAPPSAPHLTYAPMAPVPAIVSHAVPIHFVARAGADDRYRISAAGKSCTTPCTLELVPGQIHLDADGGHGSYGSPLAVPDLPATVAVSHRSRGHYALGGALLAVGLVDVALGSWFAFGNGFDGHEALGGVSIGLGGVAAIIGIVDLALAGRARLDVKVEATSAADRSVR
jgi:hypothetical protein